MKIIGFVGSPRAHGNTATMVSQALVGAKEAGADVELIHLSGLSINGCKGCKYCKSHDSCRLEDDMQPLYEKIKSADALIFGTPVYFAQMTGQMKQFIDRFYALIDAEYRPKVAAGKKAAVIITQGDVNPASFTGIIGTFEFAMSFLSIPITHHLIIPGLDAPKDVEKNPSALEEATRIGRDLFSQ